MPQDPTTKRAVPLSEWEQRVKKHYGIADDEWAKAGTPDPKVAGQYGYKADDPFEQLAAKGKYLSEQKKMASLPTETPPYWDTPIIPIKPPAPVAQEPEPAPVQPVRPRPQGQRRQAPLRPQAGFGAWQEPVPSRQQIRQADRQRRGPVLPQSEGFMVNPTAQTLNQVAGAKLPERIQTPRPKRGPAQPMRPGAVQTMPAPTQTPDIRRRTGMELQQDLLLNLGQGALELGGAVPNLINPNWGLSRWFNRAAETVGSYRSEPIRQREAIANAAIQAQNPDGFIPLAKATAQAYLDDPALAAQFAIKQVPSMLISGGAAQLTKAASLARGATPLLAAARATRAAGLTNAALNAGGARGEAFRDIQQTLTQQGVSPEEAASRASMESLVPAGVGAVTGYIGGKTGLEKAVSGGTLAGRLGLRRIGAAGAELGGEQLEEVTPQIATNLMAGRYDQRSPFRDVGRTSVETMIGAGPGAGLAAIATRPDGGAAKTPDALQAERQPPGTEPLTEPLTPPGVPAGINRPGQPQGVPRGQLPGIFPTEAKPFQPPTPEAFRKGLINEGVLPPGNLGAGVSQSEDTISDRWGEYTSQSGRPDVVRTALDQAEQAQRQFEQSEADGRDQDALDALARREKALKAAHNQVRTNTPEGVTAKQRLVAEIQGNQRRMQAYKQRARQRKKQENAQTRSWPDAKIDKQGRLDFLAKASDSASRRADELRAEGRAEEAEQWVDHSWALYAMANEIREGKISPDTPLPMAPGQDARREAAQRELEAQRSEAAATSKVPPASETAAPGPASESPVRRTRPQSDSKSSFYTVTTEDWGPLDVQIIRMADGSVVVVDSRENGIAMERNAAFAKDKSEDELLRYFYEPGGLVGIESAAQSPADAALSRENDNRIDSTQDYPGGELPRTAGIRLEGQPIEAPQRARSIPMRPGPARISPNPLTLVSRNITGRQVAQRIEEGLPALQAEYDEKAAKRGKEPKIAQPREVKAGFGNIAEAMYKAPVDIYSTVRKAYNIPEDATETTVYNALESRIAEEMSDATGRTVEAEDVRRASDADWAAWSNKYGKRKFSEQNISDIRDLVMGKGRGSLFNILEMSELYTGEEKASPQKIQNELRREFAQLMNVPYDEVSLSQIPPAMWRRWAVRKGLSPEARQLVESAIRRAPELKRAHQEKRDGQTPPPAAAPERTIGGPRSMRQGEKTVEPPAQLAPAQPEARAPEQRQATGKRVNVNGQEYILTPEQEAQWKVEVDDWIAENVRFASNMQDEDKKQQFLKGVGMEAAARKRRIVGALTPKEAEADAQREASMFKGKEVSVNGRNGVVVSTPFGKVKVRFNDGTEQVVTRNEVQAPVAETGTKPGTELGTKQEATGELTTGDLQAERAKRQDLKKRSPFAKEVDRADEAARRATEQAKAPAQKAPIKIVDAEGNSAITQEMTNKDKREFWYHGTHAELSEFLPRTIQDYNSVGTWFTSKQTHAPEYGPNVYQVPAIEGNFLEVRPNDDFFAVVGGNLALLEKHFGAAAAKQVRGWPIDEATERALANKLEAQGWLSESDSRTYRKLSASREIARKAMLSGPYMTDWRAMLQSAGYDGVVFRDTRNDMPARVQETHDVYLLFHDQPIQLKKIDAPTVKEVEQSPQPQAPAPTPPPAPAAKPESEYRRFGREFKPQIDAYANAKTREEAQAAEATLYREGQAAGYKRETIDAHIQDAFQARKQEAREVVRRERFGPQTQQRTSEEKPATPQKPVAPSSERDTMSAKGETMADNVKQETTQPTPAPKMGKGINVKTLTDTGWVENSPADFTGPNGERLTRDTETHREWELTTPTSRKRYPSLREAIIDITKEQPAPKQKAAAKVEAKPTPKPEPQAAAMDVKQLSDDELRDAVRKLTPAARPASPYFQEYERRGLTRMGTSTPPPVPAPASVDLGGYEQTLSPLAAAKAAKDLTARRLINGTMQTRKQYIEDAIAKGATIEIREGQPALVHMDGTYMRQQDITKTAMGYAQYLLGQKPKPEPQAEAAAPAPAPTPRVEEPATPTPTNVGRFANKTPEELASIIEMYELNIETKKAQRQAIPEAWIQGLQEARTRLKGFNPETEIATDSAFYGHPQNAGTAQEDYGLVPIKVMANTDLTWRIDKAAAIRDALQAELGKALRTKQGKKAFNTVEIEVRLDAIRATEQYLYRLQAAQKDLVPVDEPAAQAQPEAPAKPKAKRAAKPKTAPTPEQPKAAAPTPATEPAITVGQSVKFKNVVDPGDEARVMRVIEDRDERVVVEDANTSMRIRPQAVYLKSELRPATPEESAQPEATTQQRKTGDEQAAEGALMTPEEWRQQNPDTPEVQKELQIAEALFAEAAKLGFTESGWEKPRLSTQAVAKILRKFKESPSRFMTGLSSGVELLEGRGMYHGTYSLIRRPTTATRRHWTVINRAFELGKPVSAASVDAYQMSIPSNYTRVGDRYETIPPAQSEAAPAPATSESPTTAPKQRVLDWLTANSTNRKNTFEIKDLRAAVGNDIDHALFELSKAGAIGLLKDDAPVAIRTDAWKAERLADQFGNWYNGVSLGDERLKAAIAQSKGESKEPWQVPRDAYITEASGWEAWRMPEFRRRQREFDTLGDRQRPYMQQRFPDYSYAATYTNLTADGEMRVRTLESAHRRMVEQALADGQDVPAEVLADYPDLAATNKGETPAQMPDPRPALRQQRDDLEAEITKLKESRQQIETALSKAQKSGAEKRIAKLRAERNAIDQNLERTQAKDEDLRRVLYRANIEATRQSVTEPVWKLALDLKWRELNGDKPSNDETRNALAQMRDIITPVLKRAGVKADRIDSFANELALDVIAQPASDFYGEWEKRIPGRLATEQEQAAKVAERERKQKEEAKQAEARKQAANQAAQEEADQFGEVYPLAHQYIPPSAWTGNRAASDAEYVASNEAFFRKSDLSFRQQKRFSKASTSNARTFTAAQMTKIWADFGQRPRQEGQVLGVFQRQPRATDPKKTKIIPHAIIEVNGEYLAVDAALLQMGYQLTQPDSVWVDLTSKTPTVELRRDGRPVAYISPLAVAPDYLEAEANRIKQELQPAAPAQAEEPGIVKDARKRLKETGTGERAGAGLGSMADQAIVTGYAIYKKGMAFAEWSRQMLRELGQAVRPHLQTAWTKIKAAAKEFWEDEEGSFVVSPGPPKQTAMLKAAQARREAQTGQVGQVQPRQVVRPGKRLVRPSAPAQAQAPTPPRGTTPPATPKGPEKGLPFRLGGKSLRSPQSTLNVIGTYEAWAGPVGREVSDAFRLAHHRISTGQYTREDGLKALRDTLKPLKEQLKEENYPGLVRMIDEHVEALSRGDELFGATARFLKSFQYNTKLRFNPRSIGLNALQPLQTLWPHFSTREFLSLAIEARKPEVRAKYAAIAAAESGGKIEGLDGKKSKFPNPFLTASDTNRIMGHLAGLRIAERMGLTGEAAELMAADWAAKVEFDNSIWNIPPLFRGNIASVAGQFKPFLVKNLERLEADWKRAPQGSTSGTLARRAKIIAGQLIIGGMRSFLLPGIKPLTGVLILGYLAKAFSAAGLDDDDANKAAETVYFGLPALLAQDLSVSVAILDEPFGETIYEQVLNFLGPTLSTAVGLMEESNKLGTALYEHFTGTGSPRAKQTPKEKAQASALRMAKRVTPYTKSVLAAYYAAKGETPPIWLGKEERMTLPETGGMFMMGTPLRQTKFYEQKEAYDWQKKLVGINAGPKMPDRQRGEPEDVYNTRVQRVEGWRSTYGPKLEGNRRFAALSEDDKKRVREMLDRRILDHAGRKKPEPRKLEPEQLLLDMKRNDKAAKTRESKQLYVAP